MSHYFEEYPFKEDKKIYSPMRRLFQLTAGAKKKLKGNSFEKRARKTMSSNNFKIDNESLNQIIRKENQHLKYVNDNNNNYNMLNYINNNVKNSILNTYNNDLIKDKNSNNNYIQLQNNIININNNQYSYKQNVINNVKTKTNSAKKRKINTPNYNQFNINQDKNKKNEEKFKTKNNQINKNNNIYASKGVFKYKINKIKESNNYNISINNKSNINNNKKNNEYKNDVSGLDMDYSNMHIFSSRASTRNYAQKMNNKKINNITKNKSNLTKTLYDNYIKNSEIKDIELNHRSTQQKKDINIKNINNNMNIMTKDISNNSIFNNENSINERSNYEKNNIKTYFSTLLNNNVYSPKNHLSRVHSQENFYNKKIKPCWNNKNNSSQNLIGVPYMKKNSSYIMKQKGNVTDDEIYNIKPDIYPEIKINLNDKVKPLNKNNSFILGKDIKNDMMKDNSNYNSLKNNLSFTYRKNKIQKNDLSNISKQNKLINLKLGGNINNKIYMNTNFDNDINKYALKDNIIKKEIISSFISCEELNYIIISLEKIKDIFDSLSNDNKINFTINYCFEFINYIYNYKIDNYISKSSIDIMDIDTRKRFNNYFLIMVVIIYDIVSKGKKLYNKLKILIKESIKLMYTNIILIINYSKDIVVSKKKVLLEKFIININKRYIKNKSLYIDDKEYLLINKNPGSALSPKDKLKYNFNFIRRNIDTIIDNMKESENYNSFMQIVKQINNISIENIYNFYINKIFAVNIINSTLKASSKILSNKNTNNNTKFKLKPSKKLYTLIISLDETLIHFKIENKNKNDNKGVIQLRPWLNEFLSEIKPYYEIIVFSNGDKKYTELIINAIDKNRFYFENLLYRDHCITMNNDLVKDISILGRDITKVIIVDNLIQNYRLQIENGINIKSFYGEINDKILLELGKILIKIKKYGGDVRKAIKYYREDIINKISSNIYSEFYK